MKLLAAFLYALLLPVAAQAQSVQSAGQNAYTWLFLVDAGKYDQSWETASAFFQSKATKEQWLAIIQPVRDGVGVLVSRQPGKITLTDELPGAPFGHYAVVTFRTGFALKGDATETVIMKKEDGEWKVACYFIT